MLLWYLTVGGREVPFQLIRNRLTYFHRLWKLSHNLLLISYAAHLMSCYKEMFTSQLENKSWFYQKWMPSWARGSYEKKWLRTKFRMEIPNVQMEKCCTTRAIHLSPLPRNDFMQFWSSLNSENLIRLIPTTLKVKIWEWAHFGSRADLKKKLYADFFDKIIKLGSVTNARNQNWVMLVMAI